jgi:simple sugar transport system ATP-binding protein
MRSIVKRYSHVVANDDVDFDLRPGEIHALLGENGAGKTTLMKILFGMVEPDAGQILINGEPVEFQSPRDALDRRIGMVHQHFMLVPQFSVAENVVLGSKPFWNPRLRAADIENSVRAAAQQFGIHLDPAQRVGDLPIDVQQRVEILKLLYRGATTLILDEPTAALGPAEIEQLFLSLRDLSSSGHSVVIITHKLSEVMDIADRVTVLRQGKVVKVTERGTFDRNDLAVAMVGHALVEVISTPHGADNREYRLTVRDLVVKGDRGHTAVDGVSFGVEPGEILGIAGVEGNGQVELAQALSGLRHPAAGKIEFTGRDITRSNPRELHRYGVSIITEDRLTWDLIPELTVAENLALGAVASGGYVKRGLLRRRDMRVDAERLLHEFGVQPPLPQLAAGALSGGNQQKVVLARELSRQPSVLIVAQPTRGLDVAASEFVHRRLLELREDNCAVVLFSLDLGELLSLSDRIVVLFRGRIAYGGSVEQVTTAEVAKAMAGTRVAS